LADLGERFVVVNFRNGQRPTGGFVPVSRVDSLNMKVSAAS
jgi:hypothetical protein